jgi:isopentenyl-diphosphate Delta-isomerase
MDNLIIVDEKDNMLRFETKDKCHEGNGILHRAFSVFIFNEKRELLIQQRSDFKRLWPSHWSNSCCSHPRAGEHFLAAAERRLREEVGISCRLKYVYKFRYWASYSDLGSENEVCSVLLGKSDARIIPNPLEVSGYKWMNVEDIAKDINNNPENYTPWFRMELQELMQYHKNEIHEFC